MARKIGDAKALNIDQSFTATGTSVERDALGERFNMSISGTFVGTIALQRSFDEGVTFFDVEEFTAPVEKTGDHSVRNATTRPLLYRFNVSAYTSGTIRAILFQ